MSWLGIVAVVWLIVSILGLVVLVTRAKPQPTLGAREVVRLRARAEGLEREAAAWHRNLEVADARVEELEGLLRDLMKRVPGTYPRARAVLEEDDVS